MKQLRIIALLMAATLCLAGCGGDKNPTDAPAPTPTAGIVADEPVDAPDVPDQTGSESNIPDATTSEEPTKEGETYKTAGMYLGMADNNLLVIIEANPQDGKREKSYQISPDIDLEAMGIQEGSMVDIEYTVDENGMKKVKTISVQY